MASSKTSQQEILIQKELFLIETISDIDELFDDLLSKGSDHEEVKDERIPYWAELWPSAIGLSNYLMRNGIIRPGMTVLEIGCGIGLPGIVSGKKGARVIFSDYIQEALDLAEINWKKNHAADAQFLLMDWRKPIEGLNVDLILASDIAYESRSFEPLMNTFKTLMNARAQILIAEPNRAFAQSFFKDLSDFGFSVKADLEQLRYRDHDYSINIFELRQAL